MVISKLMRIFALPILLIPMTTQPIISSWLRSSAAQTFLLGATAFNTLAVYALKADKRALPFLAAVSLLSSTWIAHIDDSQESFATKKNRNKLLWKNNVKCVCGQEFPDLEKDAKKANAL